jgi:ABC-type polysaccharide/polyol phosphate transport system ATPase subunit
MSLPIVSEAGLETPPSCSAAPVIQLDNVGVRYRVPLEKYWSFKEYMVQRLRGRVDYHELWALDSVSMAVHEGEVFGVVGRNGAGKSTLLKVISRVLRPTRGRVRVWGHLAPLLELGAGFHSELTGRENVFLNGALLGHTQAEITQKFDEILSFADIEAFMDAPLRTYSSGMIARLGFAVATAWEPDLLILDEVLAVGDEAFQQKCHHRIQSFQQKGATVVLVSHNPGQIQALCQRAIWLDHGAVMAEGEPSAVVARYRESQSA